MEDLRRLLLLRVLVVLVLGPCVKQSVGYAGLAMVSSFLPGWLPPRQPIFLPSTGWRG